MEGYKKTDNIGFNKITGDNIVDIEAVAENFEIADETLGDIKGTVLNGYDEVEHGEKSAANFVKFIWGKLGSIELTDLKVKVTTWGGKMLNVVLKELKDKDTEIVDTMGEYKASVDEYSKNLGIYVERHRVANDRLEKLLRG
ncbi:hypothetical protein HMPREF0631_1391 [Peptostreptococcus anaerobius 653-L]|uniref:Uncharacterized protein n=1 Tax=Peptostreptococcus anaerobius 653-L TaxID=596329 RepID=D3MU85_9FIRM|nr:hypothetical protein [Peptostreptococcus anaerobius]EFD04375.1 hypothetical protein HMPREF0631_1391 [Peptostreptococcus anaerobius 653-L]